MKIPRSQRMQAALLLLQQQAGCYFTLGQVARYMGLKPSPYLRDILWELAQDHPAVHRIAVTAINGRPAWGFYFSQQQHQLELEMEQCL